jgi:hypothetical protein
MKKNGSARRRQTRKEKFAVIACDARQRILC